MKVYNTVAASIARILAEHPRCIAFAPSLRYEVAPEATSGEHTRRALQRHTIQAWALACEPRIEALTLKNESSCLTLEYVHVDIGAAGAYAKAWLLTVTFGLVTYYVAIEAV